MSISFVIIEYYSVKDVFICYSSFVKQFSSDYAYEVIVSSNSTYSVERQNELILMNKKLKWIFNNKNGGFAYAMNQGLMVATGDIIVLINPDVKLRSGIEHMLDYLCSHSAIGIIAPKIKNSRGEVQDSFRSFITPINFIKRHINRILNGKNRIKIGECPIEVDWVIGAFMMMSRQAYESVKGLDEHYFLYCEDMDICTRMHKNGFQVLYYPEAVIEYEGTRSARKSLKYAWVFFNSLIYYWRKFGFFVTRS